MEALVPAVCCGLPGSIRSCRIPSLIHHIRHAVSPVVPVEGMASRCRSGITRASVVPECPIEQRLASVVPGAGRVAVRLIR